MQIIDLPDPVDQQFVNHVYETAKAEGNRERSYTAKELADDCEYWHEKAFQCPRCGGEDWRECECPPCYDNAADVRYWRGLMKFFRYLPKDMVIEQ